MAEIAEQHGTDPHETVLDILLETEARVSIIHFEMKEENFHTVLRHPSEAQIDADL